MNEQLQQALVGIIEKATTGIDSATAFLSAEMPDVVHQLLLWYGVKSALVSAFGVGLLVIFMWFLKKYCGKGEVVLYPNDVKKYKETATHDTNGNAHGGTVPVAVAGVIISIIVLSIISTNADWLKILIAPKIWLIEYAAMLVK